MASAMEPSTATAGSDMIEMTIQFLVRDGIAA